MTTINDIPKLSDEDIKRAVRYAKKSLECCGKGLAPRCGDLSCLECEVTIDTAVISLADQVDAKDKEITRLKRSRRKVLRIMGWENDGCPCKDCTTIRGLLAEDKEED